MKEMTKIMLELAYDECNEEDRSTEYMLQYMQDYAGVDLDCVIRYLEKYVGFKEK